MSYEEPLKGRFFGVIDVSGGHTGVFKYLSICQMEKKLTFFPWSQRAVLGTLSGVCREADFNLIQ